MKGEKDRSERKSHPGQTSLALKYKYCKAKHLLSHTLLCGCRNCIENESGKWNGGWWWFCKFCFMVGEVDQVAAALQH